MTAAQVFDSAIEVGEDELKRSSAALGFSGLAAGIGMGLSGLGAAAITAVAGSSPRAALLGSLMYPLGFIVVIVGRQQLFTENTLYPVILVLARRRHLLNTARLWSVVFATNVIGALAFAALMVSTSTLEPSVRTALEHLGTQAMKGSWVHVFWAGVAGGWIIALVAWVVSASRFTIAQVVLVWLLAFVVGAAHLAHCIAGSGEILATVVGGKAGAGDYLYWLSAATVGNIVGGVAIVSVLNYAQVVGSGKDHERTARSLEEIEQARTWPVRRRSRVA
jgi:formate/nitrite transporter FocA (FNT family)